MTTVSKIWERAIGDVTASVRAQIRRATLEIFTLNYVSSAVEKARIVSIAERITIIPQKKKINRFGMVSSLREANKKSQKLVPLVKMAGKMEVYASP